MRDTAFHHREPGPVRNARSALRRVERLGHIPAFRAARWFRHLRGFLRIALAAVPPKGRP